MPSPLKLKENLQGVLCCPVCKGRLDSLKNDELHCASQSCARTFPVVDGIPVLINDNNSLFSIEDFTAKRATFPSGGGSGIGSILKGMIPDISANLHGSENCRRLAKSLLAESENPKVLVVGGSSLGSGTEELLADKSIDVIESDISFGPRTMVICDGHDLPFLDGTLDGVVVQAVLEHVVDPARCVDEIHRVLKPNGFLYAETPFMQQVHTGAYDFTRFTDLGHRRLFRAFREIDRGVLCGPGMALAWSYQYFLLSFSANPRMRQIIRAFSRITGFWLKYFDPYLSNKPGGYDSASGLYFFGQKQADTLTDKELVSMYRGAM